MGRPPSRVDVLTSIKEVEFADAWPRRTATNYESIHAHVISRQDLVVNKQTVGRPQDLLDVSYLKDAEKTIEKLSPRPKAKNRKPKGPKKGNRS